jgi:TPR repeat protein
MQRFALILISCIALAAPAWSASFPAARSVGQDYRAAITWFRLAAQGDRVGWSEASKAFALGDYETALREYRLQADQGDAMAQAVLGTMYAAAWGVPQDYAEAVKWTRLAANQGNAFGQGFLGLMYLQGLGVLQSYAEAFKWLRLAANQGDLSGQHNFATMYSNGWGVPQDFVKAHMWFNLAAAQGVESAESAAKAPYGTDGDIAVAEISEAAAKVRDIIAKRMTPADVSKAQRMAREWLAKHGKAD